MLNPRRARKLFLEAIPQYVDEYLDALREYAARAERRGARAIRRWSSCCSATARGVSSRAELRPDHEPGVGAGHLGPRLDLELPDPLRPGDRRRRRDRGDGPRADGVRAQFLRDFIEPTKQPYAPNEAERVQLSALAALADSEQPTRAPKRSKRKSTTSAASHYDKPGKIFPMLYRNPGPGARPSPGRVHPSRHPGPHRGGAARSDSAALANNLNSKHSLEYCL